MATWVSDRGDSPLLRTRLNSLSFIEVSLYIHPIVQNPKDFQPFRELAIENQVSPNKLAIALR
jgi:hypothetical protein